jgi:HlyD family secretion protein
VLDLSFGAGGVVREVLVKEGDTVRRGQLLARTDDRQQQIAAANARATLAEARDALAELQKPEVDADRVRQQRAQVLRAADNLREAEATLADLQNPETDEDALRRQRDAVRRSREALTEQRDTLEELEDADAGRDRLRQQRASVRKAEDSLEEAEDALAELEEPEKDADRIRRQRAQVGQARSTLTEARDTLAELESPEVDEDAVVRQRRTVERAERALEQAWLSLADTTLEAPFAGTITDVNVLPGGRAGGGAFRLVDTRDRYISLTLSENDVVDVAVSQPARLSVDSLPEWRADGVVEYVAPAAQTTNGVVTYEVRLRVPNTDETVKVGMTVNADIVTASKRGVLLVPNAALLPKGSGRVVEAPAPNGQGVRELPVRIGISDGARTEILGGLREGDVIVADPAADDPAADNGPFGP